MPLGLAPGIGLSTYLAYGLMMGQGLTKTEAFTSVSCEFSSDSEVNLSFD
jgi:xanthine/uracil/vitamin C permease (AzgA family)